MSADAEAIRPDRILILRRGDLRIAMPLLDAKDDAGHRLDSTPTGIIISALPTILLQQQNAPGGVDLGPPLDDDAAVLMLRVLDAEDPLVPDVGLVIQTEGLWTAGGPDEAGRTAATARVPELEVELVDVERPVIALRGVDLDLNVVSDTWGQRDGTVDAPADVLDAVDDAAQMQAEAGPSLADEGEAPWWTDGA